MGIEVKEDRISFFIVLFVGFLPVGKFGLSKGFSSSSAGEQKLILE